MRSDSSHLDSILRNSARLLSAAATCASSSPNPRFASTSARSRYFLASSTFPSRTKPRPMSVYILHCAVDALDVGARASAPRLAAAAAFTSSAFASHVPSDTVTPPYANANANAPNAPSRPSRALPRVSARVLSRIHIFILGPNRVGVVVVIRDPLPHPVSLVLVVPRRASSSIIAPISPLVLVPILVLVLVHRPPTSLDDVSRVGCLVCVCVSYIDCIPIRLIHTSVLIQTPSVLRSTRCGSVYVCMYIPFDRSHYVHTPHRWMTIKNPKRRLERTGRRYDE